MKQPTDTQLSGITSVQESCITLFTKTVSLKLSEIRKFKTNVLIKLQIQEWESC